MLGNPARGSGESRSTHLTGLFFLEKLISIRLRLRSVAPSVPRLEGGLSWGLLGTATTGGRIGDVAVDPTVVSLGISLLKIPYRSYKSFFFFSPVCVRRVASPPQGNGSESITHKYPLRERSRKS